MPPEGRPPDPAKLEKKPERKNKERRSEPTDYPGTGVLHRVFAGRGWLGEEIQTGKWADLIVLSRNPLDDIKNTKSITDVYIAGNKVH